MSAEEAGGREAGTLARFPGRASSVADTRRRVEDYRQVLAEAEQALDGVDDGGWLGRTRMMLALFGMTLDQCERLAGELERLEEENGLLRLLFRDYLADSEAARLVAEVARRQAEDAVADELTILRRRVKQTERTVQLSRQVLATMRRQLARRGRQAEGEG